MIILMSCFNTRMQGFLVVRNAPSLPETVPQAKNRLAIATKHPAYLRYADASMQHPIAWFL